MNSIKAHRSVLLSLAAVLLLPFFIFGQNLEIHYINVQQGGSTLIKGPNGKVILYDGGDETKGTNEVVPYLQSLGITTATKLDYMIASHLDLDHYGGLTEAINSGYDALKVYYNGSNKTNTPIEEFKAAAATTSSGGVIAMQLGEIIDLGNGAKATCVAVNGFVAGVGLINGAHDNENDRSIALLVQYGSFDYLICGDLGGGDDDNSCTGRSTGQVNVETPLVNAIMPGGANPLLTSNGVEISHVNHHGSESSTNKDYMNLLTPTVAIISVGAGQGATWHHPRKDVVEKVLLAQASCITASPALVLQTEEGQPTGSGTSFAGYCVGDVIISTDGSSGYSITATGAVSQGPDERSGAGLPAAFSLDGGGGSDTTPPVISNVHTENVLATSADVVWSTDEPATSVVRYGTSPGNHATTVSNTSLVTAHRVGLTGLSASTTYYYVVESADAAGNTSTSSEFSFATSSTSGPVNYAASSTSILTGTLSSGSHTNLASDDGSYFVVNSARSGNSSITDWYGQAVISESPGSVTKLTVTYDGKYSASRTQVLYLFNFSNSSWTQIDSRTVGTTDVTVTVSQASPASFISSGREIRLRVRATASRNSTFSCSGDFMRFTVETSTGSQANVTGWDQLEPRSLPTVPTEMRLYQNMPNPFNPTTTIRFDLPEPGNVSLRVYNALGQEIKVLTDDYRDAGTHSVRFDAQGLASGVYFYRLISGSLVLTEKMSLMK
ncbi:MAG: T9SS type A sorting domain-containing protein [Ignavibacteriales bacterium]|nr:T9SS type A sorting domain-containing protein [Ignavibacteriales bacterium]